MSIEEELHADRVIQKSPRDLDRKRRLVAGITEAFVDAYGVRPEHVQIFIQEDADAVGLSILSGAHMTLVPRIVELLKERGIDDVLVTVGGTIPSNDIPQLKELGVAEVFTAGAPTQAIIDFIQGAVPQS